MSAMVSTPVQTIEPLNLPVLHSVSRARAGRKLAYGLGGLLLTLPLVLLFVPWQQNVPGAGRVTAVDPRQRVQSIPAQVTGRLVKLNVQEGSRVTKGDVLARMEDQDPNFYRNLQFQRNRAQDKVNAAHRNLENYDKQLIQLIEGRDAALDAARFVRDAATEKVLEADSDLTAANALSFEKELDFQRQKTLNDGGVKSDKDLQEAQRKLQEAQAKVEGALAKVEQAKKERSSKDSAILKVGGTENAKIEETRSKREEAIGKLAAAETELNEAEILVARQENQDILAPMDGTILSIAGADSVDLISRGQAVFEIVPDTELFAVEMWMRGIDAPLISPGRTSRLQFEGWPAVQFAGWPSVAVGTFGGIVTLVDSQASADGRVRVLIVPDPDDDPWPDEPFLRQGVRASGWVQLETVSAGYEIWRQLNAFPPSIRNGPDLSMDKDGKKKMDDGSKDKDKK